MDESYATRRYRGRSVSMYADLLNNALALWDGALDAPTLFDHALECREALLVANVGTKEDTYVTLAREIAYDRALIKLSEAFDIDARAADFVHPGEERRRLERELAAHGVNLAGPSPNYPH